jgi:hypothetical protein
VQLRRSCIRISSPAGERRLARRAGQKRCVTTGGQSSARLSSPKSARAHRGLEEARQEPRPSKNGSNSPLPRITFPIDREPTLFHSFDTMRPVKILKKQSSLTCPSFVNYVKPEVSPFSPISLEQQERPTRSNQTGSMKKSGCLRPGSSEANQINRDRTRQGCERT